MNRLVDVALPTGIDRTFTYTLPVELEASARVGCRVIVPFGRKFATGVLVSFPDSTTLRELKPIQDVLDASPVVSTELLRLCQWIAEYYIVPLGDVLKAALPQGLSNASERIVTLPPSTALVGTQEISSGRQKILGILQEKGETTASQLQKKTGLRSIHGILNEMEKQGLVVTREEIPHSAPKPKMRASLDLRLTTAEQIDAYTATLSPRRKAAIRLLDAMKNLKERGRQEIDTVDLLKATRGTSAALKEIIDAGVGTILQTQMSRRQDYGIEEQTLSLRLNVQQQSVFDTCREALDAGQSKTFLLHGVTGSGKTQVYIEALRHCRSLGKSAIVLVPEISLTPQTVRRFTSHFGHTVSVVHSRMSAGERHDAWRSFLTGESTICVGPRSAIFSPLTNIGLIIVDEEHEASYKQFDASPRYHARDVAVVRGVHSGAVVILGTATPSAESWLNAQNGKYELLTMPDRVEDVHMPAITIVDMNAERKAAYQKFKESLAADQRVRLKEFRQSTFSSLLIEKITERLERREGIILLQNRRGFAPFVECDECGYVEMCDNCNVTLTYHLTRKHLRCHYCGITRPPHEQCPSCGGSAIRMQGFGTQRVEEDLTKMFPAARVIRMDLDTTTRKNAHDTLLRKFGAREADILLGTQMVAKGLDFPHVTLVGVISADTQMLLPDFRSAERTFQLLTQVAGRAGRSALKGEVIIQTRQPDHYSLTHVSSHDVKGFFEEELTQRRELQYPPYSRLVLVETRGINEEKVRRASESFAASLRQRGIPGSVVGPAPAALSKINKNYRWHLLVKGDKVADPSGGQLRRALRDALERSAPGRSDASRLIIDVDPSGVM